MSIRQIPIPCTDAREYEVPHDLLTDVIEVYREDIIKMATIHRIVLPVVLKTRENTLVYHIPSKLNFIWVDVFWGAGTYLYKLMQKVMFQSKIDTVG